jgi:alpha-ribazole phosphatase
VSHSGLVVLCRHGATEANLARRFLSREDPPLAPGGRVQCERLRIDLEAYRITSVLSSPARRCLETAALALPGIPAEARSELREIDFGSWEGHTLDELRLTVPLEVDERSKDAVAFRPPGGESFADVALRLRPLVRELERSPARVAIVAHRGTLAVLERLLRGLDLRDRSVVPMEPADYRVLEDDGAGFTS